MATTSRALSWIALLLAALAACKEAIYYVEHPGRSGPAVAIVLVSVAVVVLSAASLRAPSS